MLGRPLDKGRLKADILSCLEIIVMGGDHHACRGLYSQTFGSALISIGIWLVGPYNLSSQDHVPRIVIVFCEIDGKRDMTVGTEMRR
jgi:hypothetical protein